jgi:hypothetical protein
MSITLGGGTMATVHVFVSTGRFRSFDEMRKFIDPTYTENGDMVPSVFMEEVGLSCYEPRCIEAIHLGRRVTLSELLAGASCAEQWLPRLDCSRIADAAICVFEPNMVAHPRRSSLEYVGAFEYQVVFSDWFKRLIEGEQV